MEPSLASLYLALYKTLLYSCIKTHINLLPLLKPSLASLFQALYELQLCITCSPYYNVSMYYVITAYDSLQFPTSTGRSVFHGATAEHGQRPAVGLLLCTECKWGQRSSHRVCVCNEGLEVCWYKDLYKMLTL